MNRSESGYKPNFGMPRKELPSIKRELYEIAGGKCQYAGGCEETNIDSLTINHKISRRTARFLKLPKKVVNSLGNLELLCWPHHLITDKDNSTATKEDIIKGYAGIAA